MDGIGLLETHMLTPTKMVRSLIEQGLTQKQIATIIGSTQQRVSKIAQGDGCNYFTGKALEKLYSDVMLEKKNLKEVI